MFLLVLNVTNHRAKLRTRIRKSYKTLLPRKTSGRPAFLFDEFGRSGFYIPHQIRKRQIWLHANEQMHMIRHIIYHNQLLLLSRDDASDVFLQLVVMFGFDEALPAFDGEHDMDINLRVGICHEPKMPLLTELENLSLFEFYKDVAPTALPATNISSKDGRQACISVVYFCIGNFLSVCHAATVPEDSEICRKKAASV